jgi:hypothetical protein
MHRPSKPGRTELERLRTAAAPQHYSRQPEIIGADFAARRPANPITLCDGHGADFMTVAGQILMAGHTAPAGDYRDGQWSADAGGVRRPVLSIACNPGCRVVSGRF